MCAVDGIRHGSHGVYSEGNSSENYPLERQVARSSQSNYQSNSVDYN